MLIAYKYNFLPDLESCEKYIPLCKPYQLFSINYLIHIICGNYCIRTFLSKNPTYTDLNPDDEHNYDADSNHINDPVVFNIMSIDKINNIYDEFVNNLPEYWGVAFSAIHNIEYCYVLDYVAKLKYNILNKWNNDRLTSINAFLNYIKIILNNQLNVRLPLPFNINTLYMCNISGTNTDPRCNGISLNFEKYKWSVTKDIITFRDIIEGIYRLKSSKSCCPNKIDYWYELYSDEKIIIYSYDQNTDEFKKYLEKYDDLNIYFNVDDFNYDENFMIICMNFDHGS